MEHYWDVLRRLADELEADFHGKAVYVGDELRKMAKYLSKDREASQQSVHLTALRRWLALSIFINAVLLAVVLFTIGGR